MSNATVIVTATLEIPIARIVDAVGPEVSRALVAGSGRRLVGKPNAKTMHAAIERVISALDHLERASNSTGEASARDTLMIAVKNLRTVHIRNRKK